MTDRDRLYLLRATSSSEVRNFLDRQPSRTKSDYQLLREVLIKEFTDPDSEHGLLTALETKQGRQEAPQAYYNRLRQAYFGAYNEPDLEEDVNFKSLFLRNLHPGVSHHLGTFNIVHCYLLKWQIRVYPLCAGEAHVRAAFGAAGAGGRGDTDPRACLGNRPS